MVNAQAKEKSQWDDKTKEDAARAVLTGEATFEETRRKLKLQSYQLDAWIGQYARKHWNEEKRRPPSTEEEQQVMTSVFQAVMAGRRPDREMERRVLELYVRKFLNLNGSA